MSRINLLLVLVLMLMVLSSCDQEIKQQTRSVDVFYGDVTSWRDVTLGRDFGCAVNSKGGLECWGLSQNLLFSDILGLSSSFVVSIYRGVCVLDDASNVYCEDNMGFYMPFGRVEVDALVSFESSRRLCALSDKGDILCIQAERLLMPWPQAKFENIFDAGGVLCGNLLNGGVLCDGDTSIEGLDLSRLEGVVDFDGFLDITVV